ncbi:metalloregulator ArsR/SmtB family transcription factor [Sphingopyxis chilensis]
MNGESDSDDELVELLRVLAHPVRLRLVFAIREQELAVGQIENVTGIGQPLLSQQLGVLRKADVVDTRREAKQIFYRLRPEALAPIRTLAERLDDRKAPPPADGTASAAHFARILR